MSQQIGINKEKLKLKSQTTKFSEKNLKLVQILNAMLGFLPTHEVVFKYNGVELQLNGVYDSQDWNPNEEKRAVFNFLTKAEDEADAK